MPQPGDPQFFEQLRRMLEQFGFPTDQANLDAAFAMAQQRFRATGSMSPFSGADVDPDAAWRTTLTAAKHLLPEFGSDPAPTADQLRQIADAGRLADSWVEPNTAFPSLGLEALGWTKEKWIEESGATWRRLVEPIITGSANALGEEMTTDDDDLVGLGQLFAPVLRTSASVMYRDQLKRTLARIASTVLTSCEPGVQLLSKPQVALLPSSIQTFVEGLEVPFDEVLLHLAVRENARQRLFAGVGWLGPQLNALIEHYAREIRIDLSFIGQQINLDSGEELTIEKIAEMGQSVSGSFFKPASTPQQLEVLGRLETLLALVEGWVDEVTATTTRTWLPSTNTIAEILRRRRAAGGPEQDIWRTLVGLELRPRRIRDAANLWAALTQDRGPAARDQVWNHPDLIPSSADLDDPLRFVSGENTSQTESALDAELERILRGQQ